MLVALLENIEWGGDFVVGVVAAAAVVGCFTHGLAGGSFRRLVVLTALVGVALLVSDVLYLVGDVELLDYCDSPRRSAGCEDALPFAFGLWVAPLALALVVLGREVRQRRGRPAG